MATQVQHLNKIPKWKREEVENIKNLIASHSSFGIAGIRGIPSNQLQIMRKNLRGLAKVKVCRNNLIVRALEESEDDIKKMREYVEDQTALLFTNENPFKLYKILEESKISAPIKPGNIAPEDIVVEKGPTSFPPGPIVGELQSVGIPAAIEGGKVVIRETKTVAKQGEVVNAKLASILSRLEIHPIKLGLDLRAVYENGVMYDSKVLAIDETKYFNDITSAVQKAFNLSINIVYPTRNNIVTLLSKAAQESRNLAINAEIPIPEVMPVLLSKANACMLSLAQIILQKDASAIGDKLKEMLKAKPEEKKEVKEEIKEEKIEEEKEKTEEEKESDIAAGLSSLFG